MPVTCGLSFKIIKAREDEILRYIKQKENTTLRSVAFFLLILNVFSIWMTFFEEVPNGSPYKYIIETVQSGSAQVMTVVSALLLIYIIATFRK